MSQLQNSYRLIGANPYGEQVEENSSGRRRVLSAGVWHEEGAVEHIKVCRAMSASDALLAMSSLAVADISAAFNHRISRAYAVWTATPGKPGQYQEEILKKIENSNLAGWIAFKEGVATAMGDRGLSLRKTGSLVPIPRWETVLNAPGPLGLPLGLSIGLSTRISSNWRILSPDIAKEWSPPSAAFGREITWPAGALAWWPDNASWIKPWRELASSRLPMLWMVPDSDAEKELALPPGCLVSRTEIRHQGNLLAIALRTMPGYKGAIERVSLSLLEWAGSPPMVTPNVFPVEADSFGRVPYRSSSHASTPEAVAPLRLEAAMHAAFRDLNKKYPDIDSWVSSGLGIDTEILPGRLTCEQVDAVGLARARLEEGAALIIADDAGFGKGRMLAALAITGLRQGRSVIMITENPGLFSDFYRDLLDVGGEDTPTPEVLHQEARVLDPAGNLIVRGSSTLPNPQGMKPALILTTYGQLSNDPRKEKSAWLKARMGDGAWCLLDEAHNAAGEAVVFEAVNELLDKAGGMVFASATFARTEQNLGLYRRALGLTKEGLVRVKQSLENDDGLLRQVLVEEMARAGRLLRREHPSVPPPPTVWVEPTAELISAMASFEAFWQGMFKACEAWEQAQGGKAQVAWFKLGGWLSRTVREFAMLAKVPALTEWVQGRLEENAKVVIAADLTMEAALKDGLGLKDGKGKKARNAETDDGVEEHLEGSGIYWRDRLRSLLNTVVPAPSIRPAPGSYLFQVIEGREAAEKALSQLPDWTLSPIDTLRQSLSNHQINSIELSGRQNVLVPNEKGFSAAKRGKVDRQQDVRDFNSGKTDVAVLTRAGSTGISLHAGKKFKDQRKRWLMEWGIAADTVARIQFWGRVRRRDQVLEPGYGSLAINTPYERRIRAREERKRLRLGSLTGHGRSFETEEVGPEGEAIIAEWAEDRPLAARRIGVYQPMEQVGARVERALVRALVLSEQEQVGLISRLDRGLVLASDVARFSRTDAIDRPSRYVRSTYWFGSSAGASKLGGWNVQLVERSYAAKAHANSAKVIEVLQQHRDPLTTGMVSGVQALEAWRTAWSQEPAHAYNDWRRKQIWKRAQEILPGMKLGHGLVVTNPETGQPALGLVLGVLIPENTTPQLNAASVFSPSQVGVKVFLAGMMDPIVLPLSYLFDDSSLRISGQLAQPHWFDVKPFPWVACNLEGDPLACALLGRRLGVGRLVMIMDESGVEKTVWRFPASWSFRMISGLSRDLVGAAQVLKFLRNHPDTNIELALPYGSVAYMEPMDKGVMFISDENSENEIRSKWSVPQHRNRFPKPLIKNDSNGKRVYRRFVSYKDLPVLLYSWAESGLGWRVPARFSSWLEKQASNE